ncbi:MAG: ATP-binding protein [Pseudomonadota bacterium]
MSKRLAILMSAFALAVLVIGMTFAMRAVSERASAQMQDRLALARATVLSHLRAFEQLPSVLALDSRVIKLLDPLATQEEARSVSAYLEAVRARTSSSEIFLMNQDGLTLAASNHDSDFSFVGRNYQFRPYFMDALQTGSGGMFAIGATTGVPGYFMAQRIRTTGYREGVIVVKVDLQRIVERWQSAREDFFITDDDNIIFLATRTDDLYRPLRPLEHAALFRLQASRSYEQVSANLKSPLVSQPAAGRLDAFATDDGRLVGAMPLGIHGWTIHTTTLRSELIASAIAMTAIVIFAVALLIAAAVIARQRRRYVHLQQAQNRDLEAKVTLRTQELRSEIDERKRAEENLRQTQTQLIQAAKLAALGKMSATIAHEVSQPLAALQTTLASATHLVNNKDTKPLSAKLNTAADMTGRLNRMLKHLKSFARQSKPRSQTVNLQNAVTAALAVVDPKAKSSQAIITADIVPGLYVSADEIQLQQAIVNVVANAIDAVAGSKDGERTIAIRARQTGKLVLITVRDNGPGFGEIRPQEAFEPFSTTKITGEGLGLGLAITREIVERHNGRIEIDDHPDGGAVVTIVLAAAQIAVEQPQIEPAQ